MIVWDLDEELNAMQIELNKTEVNQMTSLKDAALAYEPKLTHNITELDVIPADADIKHEVRQNQSGEEYEIDFIVKDGKEYRIPASVLEGLKVQLQANPNLTKFKVTKTGEGKATKYTVVPIM